MNALSEEQFNIEWANFYKKFEEAGLIQYYDMDKLKHELSVAPCSINEEMGTAYKGALIVHINMTMALAEYISNKIRGTFPMDKNIIYKVCCIMHLSKRFLYVENDNTWEINNRGINFKFNKELEGCLKSGDRSALEAMNLGVKLTPTELEAIKALDNEDDNKNPFKSILAIVVRQANELGYALEKERYAKIMKMKETKKEA